jgi:hypothetical protein
MMPPTIQTKFKVNLINEYHKFFEYANTMERFESFMTLNFENFKNFLKSAFRFSHSIEGVSFWIGVSQTDYASQSEINNKLFDNQKMENMSDNNGNMLSPKEQADELIAQFYLINAEEVELVNGDTELLHSLSLDDSKKCALFLVIKIKEIMDELITLPPFQKYWQLVELEIRNNEQR